MLFGLGFRQGLFALFYLGSIQWLPLVLMIFLLRELEQDNVAQWLTLAIGIAATVWMSYECCKLI